MCKKSTNNKQRFRFRLIFDNGRLDGVDRFIEADTLGQLLATLRADNHIKHNTLDVYYRGEQVGVLYREKGPFIALDNFPFAVFDWFDFFRWSQWLLTTLRGNDDRSDPYIQIIGGVV